MVGNHDYQSATDRSAYERIFPEQINYSFTHRGWQIIGLNSSEGTKAKETKISATSSHLVSIKTCPNWILIVLPSYSLIFRWATRSSRGLSMPTIYLSAAMG